MISEATLALAVERGIITPDQAAELSGLEALTADEMFTIDAVREAPVAADDEAVRLVASFADLFVTLGIVLVTWSLGYVVHRAFGPLAMWLSLVAASWILAEVFTRRRRLALPSLVLFVIFVVAVFFSCTSLALALLSESQASTTAPTWPSWPRFNDLVDGFAALMTLVLVVPHWLRFHVPLAVGAAAGAGTFAVVDFGTRLADGWPHAPAALMLLCGFLVFALAMRFDLSDRRRVTRRTDIAFWLHLLAAPLIVHPLMILFGIGVTPATGQAMLVLLVFAVFALVALAIDRRALLLSGLLYAGAAIAAIFGAGGLTGTLVPASALTLGLVVLALSAGWRPLRNAILRVLPRRLVQRLPYPAGAQAL